MGTSTLIPVFSSGRHPWKNRGTYIDPKTWGVRIRCEIRISSQIRIARLGIQQTNQEFSNGASLDICWLLWFCDPTLQCVAHEAHGASSRHCFKVTIWLFNVASWKITFFNGQIISQIIYRWAGLFCITILNSQRVIAHPSILVLLQVS